MSDTRPVAFLDSGVGGLPYLKWVRDALPSENYVYVADNAGFPYGTKPAAEVVSIVSDRVERTIRSEEPKAIVIACNTASVAALADLRNQFPVPFIGVVPAVKPAANLSRNGRIGLLATNGTISDGYTDKLIADFASSCSVVRIGDGSIVDFIENKYLRSSAEDREKALTGSIERMKSAGIDTLVIGCTHFIYIEDDLQEALDGSVEIIDSREGVGRQVIRIVESLGMNDRTDKYSRLYTTSHKNRSRYEDFADSFGLEYCGVLKN